jgi:hypothetical protein
MQAMQFVLSTYIYYRFPKRIFLIFIPVKGVSPPSCCILYVVALIWGMKAEECEHKLLCRGD